MSNDRPKRVVRELTPAERERLERHREAVAQELPDLAARDQLRKEAHDEPTLSGELRRAVHGCEQSLTVIAAQSGITPLQLDEFLTGERTLRSDVLDRLAQAVGFRVHAV